MFRSKTLFVVGAGASCEVGLPAGADLKQRIAERIDLRLDDWGHSLTHGDRDILAAIIRNITEENEPKNKALDYIRCAQQIRDGMPQAISIDNYIDAHRGNTMVELCGKLGIAKCILEAERKSQLFYDYHKGAKTFDPRELEETWHTSFMQLLTEGIARDEIDCIFENVSFITFNYDRCIEHYLVHALQNYYALDQAEAEGLVNKLTILHPYGMVGRLPWQAIREPSVPFGGSDQGDGLLAIAKQIKTFTERVEDEAALKVMRDAVQQAEVIVFLGFAFHRQNMSLIDPNKPSVAARVFATAKGISRSDCNVVVGEIHKLLDRKPQHVKVELRNDLACFGLFDEYWRSLTFD